MPVTFVVFMSCQSSRPLSYMSKVASSLTTYWPNPVGTLKGASLVHISSDAEASMELNLKASAKVVDQIAAETAIPMRFPFMCFTPVARCRRVTSRTSAFISGGACLL